MDSDNTAAGGHPEPPDPDPPRTIKTVRVPVPMVDAAEALGHPDGFSGVVRDALDTWLHGSTRGEQAEARRALAVLAGYITRHDHTA